MPELFDHIHGLMSEREPGLNAEQLRAHRAQLITDYVLFNYVSFDEASTLVLDGKLMELFKAELRIGNLPDDSNTQWEAVRYLIFQRLRLLRESKLKGD